MAFEHTYIGQTAKESNQVDSLQPPKLTSPGVSITITDECRWPDHLHYWSNLIDERERAMATEMSWSAQYQCSFDPIEPEEKTSALDGLAPCTSMGRLTSVGTFNVTTALHSLIF